MAAKRPSEGAARRGRPAATAIVAAAGSGKRLGLKTRKPFVGLAGKPLIVHTLKAIASSGMIDSIIVAAEPPCVGRVERLVRRYRIGKVSRVVPGGRTRAESVLNCLRRLDAGCAMVAVHDGGRPFIDAATIDAAVRLAARHGGCVVAVPENDTVKESGAAGKVKRTLDRSRLWRAQTPQVFRRTLIERAYAMGFAGGVPAATDDSALVEKAGGKVAILKGSYRNMKITTKDDLEVARYMMRGRRGKA